MSGFDEGFERLIRGFAKTTSRRSLLSRFELVTGVPTNHNDLNASATDWRERIDRAVENDDELAEYVSQLEQQVDESEVMPSGDDLAAELEAVLRDQRDE